MAASRRGSLLRRPLERAALAALLGAGGLLGGCTVGPKYVRPAADAPPAYKENADWKIAQPGDAIPRGNWWEIYNDSQLNALEEKITVSNQNLKIAEDQFRQARAALRISRSAYYPQVTGGVSVTHERPSQNRPFANSSASTKTPNFTDYTIPVDASYEADVWGRVRRTVESSRSEAQASAADLETVNLSLHAELAVDYFELRGADAQEQLLDSTVAAYTKALELAQERYQGGLASAVDVAQAQTQLETTRALAIDLQVQRAQLEHAIAVLVGQAPATFSLAASPLDKVPPAIPAGVPSELLERRPDIAAAERRVEAANAQIGVARAAYFPLITLAGTGEFESTRIGTLVSGPSGLWSLGASAAEILFDAGKRHAITEQARAAYDQSVATYRETVLGAFQDVEDNLAALRVLEEEAKTEGVAVNSAEHSLALSNNRYRGGVVSYLEVITAQSAALTDERAAVDIATRRMVASALLIKALGGGWNASALPAL
ncbi:MAG: efflux transporter outer membrane subunit [Candidatus Acidiferrales bacterium]